LADYIPYVLEQTNFEIDIGFVIYSTFVDIIRFVDGSSVNDIMITRVQDTSDSFAAVSPHDFLFSYHQEPEKLQSIFAFLRQRSESLREKFEIFKAENLQNQMEDVKLSNSLLLLKEILGNRGAKVFVFTNKVEKNGKYAILSEPDSAPHTTSQILKSKEPESSLFKCHVL
jgi:hypothetical protein